MVAVYRLPFASGWEKDVHEAIHPTSDVLGKNRPAVVFQQWVTNFVNGAEGGAFIDKNAEVQFGSVRFD